MKRYTEEDTGILSEILRNDGTISVPTDTVYGVCARMSEKAEARLREVKNRPKTKSFPLMCSNLAQIREIAETDERAERIIKAFMPGPVTVILKKRENVPAYVNGGMSTLAIRMATSPVLKELIELTGTPVFMTSANQSGEKTCTNLDEIEQACPLLDGMLEGSTQFGEASTIIDCSSSDIRILRPGPVTLEDIKNVLGEEN